jgi:hypothetical protein
LVAAAQHFEQGILEHNVDDWASYLLLMASKLPSTALPFEDAAHGIFGLEGGFSGLKERLCSPDFWSDARAQQTAEKQREAVQALDAVIRKAAAMVCTPRFVHV